MHYLFSFFLLTILSIHSVYIASSQPLGGLNSTHMHESINSFINIFELTPQTYWNHAAVFPAHRLIVDYQERYKTMSQCDISDHHTLKFYAFYFPQWYETVDNDWWDDWKYFNNTPMTVNGRGHPIVRPKNHIYYDPRHYITRLTQRNLARKYGIDGFIFYHYWFDKPLLGDILELMLLDGEPEVEFGLLWVNEAFGTKSAGKLTYRDPLRHAMYLSKFMKHPNYIRIDGRPVLYFYHTSVVPRSYLKGLSGYLTQVGLPTPYFVQSLQVWGDNMDFLPYVDGYAEFPPNIPTPDEIRSYPTSSIQLGLSLNYDNTPRSTQGKVFGAKPVPMKLTKGRSIPDDFRDKALITDLCIQKISNWYPINDGPKIVLIFAWNEWSEQAVLEPSDILDYQLLEAIRDCRNNFTI